MGKVIIIPLGVKMLFVMLPAAFRVSVPGAVKAPNIIRSPDDLVVSVRSPTVLSVRVVRDCNLVKLNSPEVALLNGQKVDTLFGPSKLAPPTELPVRRTAEIAPPVWLIVLPDTSVTDP